MFVKFRAKTTITWRQKNHASSTCTVREIDLLDYKGMTYEIQIVANQLIIFAITSSELVKVHQSPTVWTSFHLEFGHVDRNKSLIILQPANKFGEGSFSESGPSVWNLLPDYVKSLRSVDIFKSVRKPNLYHVVSNFISLILLCILVFGKGYAMVLYMLISSFFFTLWQLRL